MLLLFVQLLINTASAPAPLLPTAPANRSCQPLLPTAPESALTAERNKGVGWLVLLLGLGVVALPRVASDMEAATRRMISFISLGVGGIVMLWLVSQNLRHMNVGAILALAGHAVEFLCLLDRARGPRLDPEWCQAEA